MYRYVSDVSQIAHNIVKSYCSKFECAVDATLGNGHDSDFLSELFKKVYSFDIQKEAVESYRILNRENVILINDSHEKFKNYICEEVDCIMYNLGFLPGGNKKITTKASSTLLSIESGLALLKEGGIMSIAVYIGHDEGKKEWSEIKKFVENLSSSQFGVLLHTFSNRLSEAPKLIIIEKNSSKRR